MFLSGLWQFEGASALQELHQCIFFFQTITMRYNFINLQKKGKEAKGYLCYQHFSAFVLSY
ncbi:hypothetical protein E2C01_018394 [Portunus trituberculatus]|uniref:Uncharacterized protein n=1 Tax=Portunus trituberculatus TaxID=210409 RepID=A0A5B7DV17_PORTR|nr:hypothetical protein [Portunus trituberculatus]